MTKRFNKDNVYGIITNSVDSLAIDMEKAFINFMGLRLSAGAPAADRLLSLPFPYKILNDDGDALVDPPATPDFDELLVFDVTLGTAEGPGYSLAQWFGELSFEEDTTDGETTRNFSNRIITSASTANSLTVTFASGTEGTIFDTILASKRVSTLGNVSIYNPLATNETSFGLLLIFCSDPSQFFNADERTEAIFMNNCTITTRPLPSFSSDNNAQETSSIAIRSSSIRKLAINTQITRAGINSGVS